ncbi:MAG: hypothetical protein WA921_11225 [Ahrensia sp.]
MRLRDRQEAAFSRIATTGLLLAMFCFDASSTLAQDGGSPSFIDPSIEADPSMVVPLPEPFIGTSPAFPDPNDPLATTPAMPRNQTDPARSQAGLDGQIPVISYDIDALPAPVRRMRELIMDAARSGDMEALRPLIGSGADTTQLALSEIDVDPIDYLKSISGDALGHETLAILLEVLEAGYVQLDAGLDTELFIWPYFFALPLEGLTPVQRVELFKLVTAGDYEDMLSFGAYIFFRVGITPQGRWLFFVAGD